MDLESEITQQIMAAAREIKRKRKELKAERKAERLKLAAQMKAEQQKAKTLYILAQSEKIRVFAKKLREREDKKIRLSKAEVRYVYSQASMEDICRKLDLTGEEVRAFLLRRRVELRVRWGAICQPPESVLA